MTPAAPHDPLYEYQMLQTRRQFFSRLAQTVMGGVGLAALHGLAGEAMGAVAPARGVLGAPHFAPRARRIIYLVMSGAPSQLETFDYKPEMTSREDQDLPESVRGEQRLTTMTSEQSRFPIAPPQCEFRQFGRNGTWVSEHLAHIGGVVDDLCIIKSMHTEAINHDPAITFMMTGAQQPGRPSLGAWLSYGLGSLNRDLPAFMVLHSSWPGQKDTQALFNRLWGTGFLPSEHQGCSLRPTGDPVLYLADPHGVDRTTRRHMLDRLAKLNQIHYEEIGDPETNARIAQYEMAFRMQSSMPDMVDIGDEPRHILDLYGPNVTVPGTYASNCLLARRMAERDVRFIQVYTRGWDVHQRVRQDTAEMCRDIDQPTAGLILDLKQRGLLDDTLVIWGGEFGRTVYSQGNLQSDSFGRDHHPRNFCMFLAGGGIRPGISYGETDEFSYNITANPVHVHDLNATILHLLGIHHEQLTYRFQGRDFRLTDVHGTVVRDLLA